MPNIKLPFGFSPRRAVQQVGSYINPTGGVADYDVFSERSFTGGDRSPTENNGMFGGTGVTTTGMSSEGQEYDPSGLQFGGGGLQMGSDGQVQGMNTGLPSSMADPYAEARETFSSRLGGAVNNIRQSGMDAFGSAGRNLRGQAEQLFNTVNQGQKAIDRSRENVEINRLGGIDDILSFVRNGLKSGASMLANKNALGSSASRALAEAYGNIGGNRVRSVNNQAFMQGRDIDTQQGNLNLQRGQGNTDFSRARDDMVATIGQQVRSQLAQLEAEAAKIGATGPDVEAERQRIIDEGIGQLNDVDAWLQSQLGGVGPQDMATTRRNATSLRQGGAQATPFEFDQFTPDFAGGPAIDQLPIFTRTRKDQ